MRKLRRERGLTQKAVADYIGMRAHYYCMIEQGKRQSELSLVLAVKLSEVLQVPLDRIAGEEKALREEV